MDFVSIRRTAIAALFSDEVLLTQLVLKGGNALSLVYGISQRTSLDLDFSMESDFADFEDAKRRIFYALADRFDSAGYTVFDQRLEPKPRLDGEDHKPWWGGYQLTFKLMERAKFASFRTSLDKMRMNATVIGSRQERTFTVDLSKCEYTGHKAQVDFDDYTIYVYTPEMIVIEKLRALCQQLPEYSHRNRSEARARDFYDIYCVVTAKGVVLNSLENCDLAELVFGAKRVPLALLDRLPSQRELHRSDWPAVIASTTGQLEDFDFYFDFVLAEVKGLESLWMK